MKRFDDLVKELLTEQPAPAPAPTKPSAPPKPSTPTTPSKPSKPSRPHPLTPNRPGVSPNPQAKKKKMPAEDEECDNEEMTGKVTHYKN